MIFIFAYILTLQSFTIHAKAPTNYKKANIEQRIEKLNLDFEVWKIHNDAITKISKISVLIFLASSALCHISMHSILNYIERNIQGLSTNELQRSPSIILGFDFIEHIHKFAKHALLTSLLASIYSHAVIKGFKNKLTSVDQQRINRKDKCSHYA